jgi:hypothetical protein
MPKDWGFGLGSGDALDAVLGIDNAGRGRAWRRHASPHASRRRSWAALTPPITPDPPSSPTSVIPGTPTSKGCGQELLRLSAAGHDDGTIIVSPHVPSSAGAASALALLAPSSFIDISPSSRPPGFEATPEPRTPPLYTDGTPIRTSEPTPRTRRNPAAPEPELTTLASVPLAPLFLAPLPPILSPPTSSPLVRPQPRRKTLAGADITRTVKFSLRKAGARGKQRTTAAPVAWKVEAMV